MFAGAKFDTMIHIGRTVESLPVLIDLWTIYRQGEVFYDSVS